MFLPEDTADKRIRLAHKSSKVIMARETSHYTRRRINRDSRTHYYSINRSYRARPKQQLRNENPLAIDESLFFFFFFLFLFYLRFCFASSNVPSSLPKSLCLAIVHGRERVNFSIEIKDQLDGENVI